MKRRGLFLVTVMSLFFSAICMARAGWFSGHASARSAVRTSLARSQVKVCDPLTSQAAWRYRRGQPSNWRSMLMYR